MAGGGHSDSDTDDGGADRGPGGDATDTTNSHSTPLDSVAAGLAAEGADTDTDPGSRKEVLRGLFMQAGASAGGSRASTPVSDDGARPVIARMQHESGEAGSPTPDDDANNAAPQTEQSGVARDIARGKNMSWLRTGQEAAPSPPLRCSSPMTPPHRLGSALPIGFQDANDARPFRASLFAGSGSSPRSAVSASSFWSGTDGEPAGAKASADAAAAGGDERSPLSRAPRVGAGGNAAFISAPAPERALPRGSAGAAMFALPDSSSDDDE